MPRFLLPLLAGLALLSSLAPAAWSGTGPMHARQETRLVQALSQLHDGQYDQALDDLDTLIRDEPDFRLAHYLYGELMLAKAGRLTSVGYGSNDSEREALLNEARVRWSHRLQSPPADAVPNAVLELAPQYRHVVVVDLLRNRLYLLRNDDGRPRLTADFYASIGEAGAGKRVEGDAKTPVGVYHITEYKQDRELPEMYGAGAFPVNYPNNLDRLFGRTGHGIWVHGVPRDTYNRSPRASQGCVVISNQDLATLKRFVRPGITPVVFSDQLEWLSPETAKQRRQAILARVKGWRDHWQALDTDGYLAYYADDFISDSGMGKPAFADYKHRVNGNKTAVDVDLDDISAFRYPGNADMALVSFTQHYSSNNFQAVTRKRQFWRRDDAGWQIMHETSEPLPPSVRTAGK